MHRNSMLALAPLMHYVPLAALAAVLVVVAWNMSEHEHFRHTMSAPKGDRLVLLLTFFLTVFFDLTVAIEVGLVVAAFVFMFRMAETVEVSAGIIPLDQNGDENGLRADLARRRRLPPGVEAFQISGPLFFGAASRLDDVLDHFHKPPNVLILRMGLVSFVDASGVHALKMLLARCQRRGIVLIVSGLQMQPRRVIQKMRLHPRQGELHFVAGFDSALELAAELLAAHPEPHTASTDHT